MDNDDSNTGNEFTWGFPEEPKKPERIRQRSSDWDEECHEPAAKRLKPPEEANPFGDEELDKAIALSLADATRSETDPDDDLQRALAASLTEHELSQKKRQQEQQQKAQPERGNSSSGASGPASATSAVPPPPPLDSDPLRLYPTLDAVALPLKPASVKPAPGTPVVSRAPPPPPPSRPPPPPSVPDRVPSPEPPGPPLSDEQKAVAEAAVKGHSVFFTGEAGTGKSFLLRWLLRLLRNQHGVAAVAATAISGMAASNIGGCTLHSFSGLLPDDAMSVEQMVGAMLRNKAARNRWDYTKVLVVDEISMVANSDLEIFDRVARIARREDRPFGGLQLIFCGDFLQLPPIDSEADTAKYSSHYQSIKSPRRARDYAFLSPIWSKLFAPGHQFRLSQIFRQAEDDDFKDLLSCVRVGNITAHVYSQLQQRVASPEERRAVEALTSPYTYLACYRAEVNAYNNTRLAKLVGRCVSYTARDEASSTFHGTADTMERLSPLLTKLDLKVGARVLLVMNKDLAAGLYNGRQGWVIGFAEQSGHQVPLPIVRFDGDDEETSHTIYPHCYEYTVAGILAFTRTQVPLVHSWALTVHKAQGQTLKKVAIKCSKAFAAGQMYTALSRGVSLDEIVLLNEFEDNQVIASPEAVEFDRRLIQGQKLDAAITAAVQEKEDLDLYVY